MKINMEKLVSVETIKEYLKMELEEQRGNMLLGKPDKYGYLLMVLNDIGITVEED